MINFLNLCFVLFLSSCASTTKPNYASKSIPKGMSRVTVYWPRQWQSQFASFRIYANDRKLKILKNECYYEFDHMPGTIEVKSHHVQDKDYVVIMTVSAQPNKNYFLKLDTQPKEVTIMSAFDDVMAVATIVGGMKSEMRLREGRGNWTDVKNLIDKEKAVAVMESKRDALGFHILLPIEETSAIDELKACCRE